MTNRTVHVAFPGQPFGLFYLRPAARVVDAGLDVVVDDVEHQYRLDEDGEADLSLAPNDVDGTSPHGWTYTLNPAWPGDPITFALVSGDGSPVELADLTPVDVSDGVPVIIGPTGPAGAGTYDHVQTILASVWTINHPLHRYPSVSVLVGGEQVEADVAYPSLDTVTVTFAAEHLGSAHLT